MKSLLTLSLVGCALLTSACATSRTTYDSQLAYRITGSSPTSIGGAELTALERGRSIYDVISATRPLFLRYRGTTPTVSINGMLVGGPSVLTSISSAEVRRVRMIDGPEATIMYGSRHSGSVLAIELGRRD